MPKVIFYCMIKNQAFQIELLENIVWKIKKSVLFFCNWLFLSTFKFVIFFSFVILTRLSSDISLYLYDGIMLTEHVTFSVNELIDGSNCVHFQ